MSRAATSHEHPHRLAGVREHAGRLWVVVLQNRTGASVLESKSLDSRDSAGFRELLRRHRVEEVVRLAPASETICKCVTVPPGEPAAVSSALALLAEAQLPDALPPHRRASGQVPGDPSGQTVGLLTGWRGPAAPPPLEDETDERWTTVPAALAVFGGNVAAARDDAGAVTVIARGASRTIARVLITERDADFEHAVRETAHAAGGTGFQPVVGGPGDFQPVRLILDSASRQHITARVTGIPEGAAWLRDYALPLGAAMVAVESRGLAELWAAAPESRVGIVESSLAWLTEPRRAHAVTAAAVAALLLIPLGVSWGRSLVLTSKARALDDAAAPRADLDRQAALYEALEKSRWPMTKLLADIAAAAPVGVVLESIRLAPETGVALDGTAPGTEEMQQLQAAFNKSGLFRDLKIDRQESSDAGVKFTLSAKVASPHVRVPDAEDFAARPLAVRLYGEGASNTAFGGSAARAESGRRPARASRDGGDDDDARDSGARAPERPSAAAPAAIPAPLSDADIAKMDRDTSGKKWTEYVRLLGNTASMTPDVKDRLTAERDKLKARFLEQKDARPAGGPP